MTQKPRYLTKSAFRTATECPTKLGYLKKSEFLSTKNDNAFLRALADGGFQVGELAKIYHPGGIHIESLDYVEALNLTNELLQKKDAIIYEAAFRFENYFVRTDVLVKTGNAVKLIEVKAKSSDGKNEQFWARGKTLNSKWEPYLLDVAFQKWVVSNAYPHLIVTPYLMLTDKTATAEIEGMNQKFLILSEPSESNLRIKVEPGTTAETLGKPILTSIQVESEVEYLLAQDYNGRTFESHIKYLSDHYAKDERISPTLSRECRACEYRIPEDKITGKFKSGFKQCWTEAGKLTPPDFRRPLVLDIWKLHYAKKDAFIKEHRFFMDQLDRSDLEPKTKSKKTDADIEPGLSNLDRQWLQVELAREKTAKPYFDRKEISSIFENFTYPLHFIDFETTRTAIPFHRDRRPYEQVAFQFSHHVVHKNGQIEHKGQYLCFERGKFPNFDFVRELKKSLEGDQGTIFRYADHENTVLREIHSQLCSEQTAPNDAAELCAWIDTVTREKLSDNEYREGSRCMVDLKWLIQKFFYHPATNGSNSIKAVLPAILNESSALKEKYSKPIYGTPEGMRSLNFKNHAWIKLNLDGSAQDPYKNLEPVFTDLDLPAESLYEEDERVAEGGAAMTAFGRMQFTQMSESERKRVAAALLKYCELDTFAMVLIYEYWKSELELKQRKAA